MRTPTRQEWRERRAFRYALRGHGTRSAIEAVMAAALQLDHIRIAELRAGELVVLAVAPFWLRLWWLLWPWTLKARFRCAVRNGVPAGVKARLHVVGRRKFEEVADDA